MGDPAAAGPAAALDPLRAGPAAGEVDPVAWVRQRLEALLERAWRTGEPEYTPLWRCREYAAEHIGYPHFEQIEELVHLTVVAMPPEPGPLPEWPWTR